MQERNKTVSKSFINAVYRAVSSACSKIIWLRRLLSGLVFPQTNATPLHADNTNAIRTSAKPIFHERTKHFKVDCHFIRETSEDKNIALPHVPFDIFTNESAQNLQQYFTNKLLLIDSPATI